MRRDPNFAAVYRVLTDLATVTTGNKTRPAELFLSVVAAAAIFVTMREMAPSVDSFWKGACIGATSMMAAQVWVKSR